MNRSYLVDLSLVLVAIIWALNFTIIKVTLNEIDPHSFNALRFFFAAGLLYYVCRKRGYTLKVQRQHLWPLIGLGLLGNFAYQLLFIIGVDFTQVANSAVMMGTIPIWVAIISQFFTIEKLTRFEIIGVILAFSGVALIIVSGENPVSFQSKTFLGDLIILAAALCWAIFTVLSRKYLSIYSPIQFSAFMALVACITLALVGLPFMLRQNWDAVSLASYGGIAYSGLLSVGLAYIIWNNGVKKLGAVRTATYQNLVPVLGLLFGVILLGEELTLLQYIGAVLVITGIVMARIPKQKKIIPTQY